MIVRLLFAIALLLSAPAFAADPAGRAVKVTQTARVLAAADASVRLLEVPGKVFTGDLITTDDQGEAQLEFRDDTRLVVGPNSRLSIDTFIYAGRATAREVTIDAVVGAFRFLSGRSSKEAYRINFPAGTIGIRGTEFDLTVDANGDGIVALWGGTAIVCDQSGRCAELTGRCSMLRLSVGGDFDWEQNAYDRTIVLEEAFPYAFQQGGLDPRFRVQTAFGCEIRDFNQTDPLTQGGGVVSPGTTTVIIK